VCVGPVRADGDIGAPGPMTLRFGTDGVRGPASEFPDALVVAIGRAAAEVLGATTFVIGRDTRESGERLMRSLATGLAAAGADPMNLGIVPTPAVARVSAVRNVPGAVISASHNPWSDNGIKFFAAGGRKLSDELEARLEARLDAEFGGRSSNSTTDDASDSPSVDPGPLPVDTDAVAEWSDAIVASVGQLPPMHVVIDCANGAASAVAPAILERLGLRVDVLHDRPDGRNINDACGSTHPADLQRAVVESGAALGLAFDGDADRLVAVDERGELVDGDQLIALFASDMCARGSLTGDRVVVTVMSNLGFRLAMDELGIEVVETAVGDRHVLEALARTGSSLGGEQSGHIVFADQATTGDGILSGVRLVDLVTRAQRPLSELAADVMERLPQVLRNVRLDRVRVVDTDDTSRTTADALADIIATELAEDIASVERALGPRGRVLIRPSGTEPLVRVMVEAPTVSEAEEAADNLAAAVQRACSA